MSLAQVEAIDIATPSKMLTEAARLLLAEVDDGSLRYVVGENGDGALRLVTWRPSTEDVETYVADLDKGIETLYGVVERPTGYLAAAAHVIHSATACLSYDCAPGSRQMDPYTAIVGYAVQPTRMESGYDGLLMSHIASRALAVEDNFLTLSVVGPHTVNSLAPLGFFGSTELLGARPAEVVSNYSQII